MDSAYARVYVSVFGSSERRDVALKRASVAPTAPACGSVYAGARHGLVAGLPVLADDVRGDDLALILADVGQRPQARDVADRPQALAGAQLCVDRDSVSVGRDPHRLQSDAFDPGSAPGRDEQALAAELAAVVECEDVVGAVAPRGRRVDAQDELDAVAAQDLAESVAERRGLAGEHVRGALDERDLAAEAAHGLRHLHTHGAAAEDEQPARDGLHARDLAVGPDPVELAKPRDRRDDRVGAACDDDVLGRMAHAVDLDDAGSGEPAGAAQEVDARSRQPALLPGVGVLGHHEVAPRECGPDVDLCGGRRLARGMHRLAGSQERLRRDARPVRALAPDQLTLDDGDAQPAVRPARRRSAHQASRHPAR